MEILPAALSVYSAQLGSVVFDALGEIPGQRTPSRSARCKSLQFRNLSRMTLHEELPRGTGWRQRMLMSEIFFKRY